MMRLVQAVKLLHHLRETCKFAVSYRANAETREFTVVCDDRCNAQIMTEQERVRRSMVPLRRHLTEKSRPAASLLA